MDIDRIRGLLDDLFGGSVRVTKRHVLDATQGRDLDRDTMLALEGLPNESYDRESLVAHLNRSLGATNLTDLRQRV